MGLSAHRVIGQTVDYVIWGPMKMLTKYFGEVLPAPSLISSISQLQTFGRKEAFVTANGGPQRPREPPDSLSISRIVFWLPLSRNRTYPQHNPRYQCPISCPPEAK